MTIRGEIRVYLFSVDDARRLDRLLLDLNAGYNQPSWMANEAPATVHRVRIVLVSQAERIIEPTDHSVPPSRAKQSAESPVKIERSRRG